jgi:hypothetical protein
MNVANEWECRVSLFTLLLPGRSHGTSHSRTVPWERGRLGRSIFAGGTPALPGELIPGSAAVSADLFSRAGLPRSQGANCSTWLCQGTVRTVRGREQLLTTPGGDAGSIAATTDPAGLVTRTYSDALGRPVQTVEDFTDGAITDDSNKTNSFTYNSVGRTSLTAYLTGGAFEMTAWIFGVTTGTSSAIDSNDIVAATEFPDPTTGEASSSQWQVLEEKVGSVTTVRYVGARCT